MSVQFSDLAKRVAVDGEVSAAELLSLRQNGFADGRISQGEAEAIFSLNRALSDRTEEWTDFFVEAVGEYLVNQRAPIGYVDDENAAWVMGQIDADGKLCSMAELELLVRVFERAKNVPQSLKDYALAKVETAVMEGEGPTRDGGALEKGNVNATEARILRRFVFAPASDRPAGVGPHEAEMLFRLKDATRGADNAPEWKQLFAQGVGNFLEGFAAPAAQITHKQAMELEAFVADTSTDKVGFFRRLLTTDADFEGYRAFQDGRDQVFADRAALAAAGAKVTDKEKAWLDARVDADGEIDEYEQALLDFLADK